MHAADRPRGRRTAGPVAGATGEPRDRRRTGPAIRATGDSRDRPKVAQRARRIQGPVVTATLTGRSSGTSKGSQCLLGGPAAAVRMAGQSGWLVRVDGRPGRAAGPGGVRARKPGKKCTLVHRFFAIGALSRDMRPKCTTADFAGGIVHLGRFRGPDLGRARPRPARTSPDPGRRRLPTHRDRGSKGRGPLETQAAAGSRLRPRPSGTVSTGTYTR